MTRNFTIRPGWSPITVVLMVVGFIVAWPLGLAALAYILWGDRMHTWFDAARYRWGTHRWGTQRSDASGNLAFDEYREREHKRLEVERRQLETMRDEFHAFMHNPLSEQANEQYAHLNQDTSRHQAS